MKDRFSANSLSADDIFKTNNIISNHNPEETHRAAELKEMKSDLFAGFEPPSSMVEEFNQIGKIVSLLAIRYLMTLLIEPDKTFLVSQN